MADAPDSGIVRAAHASRRPDLPRLTALRGIGAIVILIGHFALTKSLRNEQLNDAFIDLLQAIAVAGVSCFFVLSGFVLTWAMAPGSAVRTFWRRRVARLVPVHVVGWVFGLAIMLATGAAFEFWKLLPSLFLLNIWVPNLDVFWGANTPSWTLACEAFFYLLFPLLLTQVWRLPESWLWPAVGLIALAITGWAATVGLLVPSTPDITDGTPIARAQYFAVVAFAPARLLDFTLGLVLARIVIAERVPGGLRPWLYVSLIGGYVAARWIIPQPLGFVFAFVPAIVIGLLYSASADVAGRASRWSSRPLLWFGELSFALYMVHWPIVFGINRWLGAPQVSIPEAVLLLAVTAAVCVAVANLVHTRVELPMYRRLAQRRPAAPPSASARTAASRRPQRTGGVAEPVAGRS